MKLVILLLTLLSACGKIDVGGTVEVNHNINVADLRNYFFEQCRQQYPSFTQYELNACADTKLAQWLDAIVGQ